MKTIEQILPGILLSGMLGDTPSKVAAELGYKGRTTVGRIMKGTAGQSATEEFCRRIAEKFGLTSGELFELDRYLDLGRRFANMLLNEHTDFSKMLIHVIDNDYSDLNLTVDGLSELKTLRHDNREIFMGMLSFAFFRQPGVNLNNLTELLKGALPDRPLGCAACATYPTSPVALGHFPPRLKEIALGAMIIKNFCYDYLDAMRYAHMIPLRDLSGRTYWSDGESDRVVLLNLVMVNNDRNAYYEFYNVSRSNGRIENVAQLFFLDSGLAGVYLKDSRLTAWARYTAAENRIELRWLNEEEPPSVMERLYPVNSRNLAVLDKSISDERLSACIYAAYGIQAVVNYKVVDVKVSRMDIELHTTGGGCVHVSRDSRSFLSCVGPDMEVMIYRDKADGLLYAEWPALGERVAIEEFADGI